MITPTTPPCFECGEPIPEGARPHSRFCSAKCRKAHWDALRAQSYALVQELADSSPGQRPGLVAHAKKLANGQTEV